MDARIISSKTLRLLFIDDGDLRQNDKKHLIYNKTYNDVCLRRRRENGNKTAHGGSKDQIPELFLPSNRALIYRTPHA